MEVQTEISRTMKLLKSIKKKPQNGSTTIPKIPISGDKISEKKNAKKNYTKKVRKAKNLKSNLLNDSNSILSS